MSGYIELAIKSPSECTLFRFATEVERIGLGLRLHAVRVKLVSPGTAQWKSLLPQASYAYDYVWLQTGIGIERARVLNGMYSTAKE